jgi:hypothetical protein
MTTKAERPAILDALKPDTRLSFWASRVSEFQAACSAAAVSRNDLWAGLTLALSETPDSILSYWCKKVAIAAFSEPAAASAALILFTSADPKSRELWSLTIRKKGTARVAYETARWAARTAPDHPMLTEMLREQATSDNSRFWTLWLRDLEHDRAQEALDGNTNADLLWAAELLEACGLNEQRLKYRLARSRKGQYAGQGEDHILQFLERRKTQQRA